MNTNKNPSSIFGKLDKADEGKQKKKVQDSVSYPYPLLTGFHGSMSFFFFVVCCTFVCMSLCECVPMGVCTRVHMWMETRDIVWLSSSLFLLVFETGSISWIWISPSWLAIKLQESFSFCLLRTRIIGMCIAPGFHVGAENLNSDPCDDIGSTLCVVFLDLFIFYVVAFWGFPGETEPKGCVKCYMYSLYKTKHIC